MKKFIRILIKIKKIFFGCKNTCRLLDIDVEKQEAVFQLKMRSTVFRLPIDEAIFRFGIVDMLTPIEACWLGGHYAKQSKGVCKKPLTKHAQSFALKKSTAVYKIIAQNRDKTMTYVDTHTKETFTKHLKTIVHNDWIMSKFDSMQAYYIGFLAGISIDDKHPKVYKKRVPTLRVVK